MVKTAVERLGDSRGKQVKESGLRSLNKRSMSIKIKKLPNCDKHMSWRVLDACLVVEREDRRVWVWFLFLSSSMVEWLTKQGLEVILLCSVDYRWRRTLLSYGFDFYLLFQLSRNLPA